MRSLRPIYAQCLVISLARLSHLGVDADGSYDDLDNDQVEGEEGGVEEIDEEEAFNQANNANGDGNIIVSFPLNYHAATRILRMFCVVY